MYFGKGSSTADFQQLTVLDLQFHGQWTLSTLAINTDEHRSTYLQVDNESQELCMSLFFIF